MEVIIDYSLHRTKHAQSGHIYNTTVITARQIKKISIKSKTWIQGFWVNWATRLRLLPYSGYTITELLVTSAYLLEMCIPTDLFYSFIVIIVKSSSYDLAKYVDVSIAMRPLLGLKETLFIESKYSQMF